MEEIRQVDGDLSPVEETKFDESYDPHASSFVTLDPRAKYIPPSDADYF